ncbi:transcription initiation factor IIB [Salinibaculum rarum]|uniref:transcription initiation factor IIB n=1 Tax=Salinibaculum rarum TaxID=3058903 RepID=UPI00266006E3|nr:TFIIB-type zinc ribbon-containing protein [Salinibaculum sp. KK48]
MPVNTRGAPIGEESPPHTVSPTVPTNTPPPEDNKTTNTPSREGESATSNSQRHGRDCDACPECDGGIEYTESNEYICKNCGLVLEEECIDHGPEWRAYSSDEKQRKSRVGPPREELHHDYGLSTQISKQDRDARGQHLSEQQRQRMNRLRTWNTRTQTENSTERNIRAGLTEIRRMGSAIDVPDATMRIAGRLYRQAAENDMLPGRSVEGMASAALYAATRQTEYPRTIDEITTVSRVEKREIGRTYRYLLDEFNITVEPTTPQQYVPRFVNNLDLSQATERKACEILEKNPTELTSGKNPAGVAAAAVYIASIKQNEKTTQAALRDVSHVTKVTIRNRYKDMIAETDIDIEN